MASASPKKPLFCHSHSRSRFRHSRSPAKGALTNTCSYGAQWWGRPHGWRAAEDGVIVDSWRVASPRCRHNILSMSLPPAVQWTNHK
jgi:ribosomal protein L24E